MPSHIAEPLFLIETKRNWIVLHSCSDALRSGHLFVFATVTDTRHGRDMFARGLALAPSSRSLFCSPVRDTRLCRRPLTNALDKRTSEHAICSAYFNRNRCSPTSPPRASVVSAKIDKALAFRVIMLASRPVFRRTKRNVTFKIDRILVRPRDEAGRRFGS